MITLKQNRDSLMAGSSLPGVFRDVCFSLRFQQQLALTVDMQVLRT